jgi:hypothetical protein
VLDYAHCREGAAIEAPTDRWPVLVDSAAPLPQVNAGSVCALLEYQAAITVPRHQEVGQASPIGLLVDRDAGVMTASRAAAAKAPDQPRRASRPSGNPVLYSPPFAWPDPSPLTLLRPPARWRGEVHRFGRRRPAAAQLFSN